MRKTRKIRVLPLAVLFAAMLFAGACGQAPQGVGTTVETAATFAEIATETAPSASAPQEKMAMTSVSATEAQDIMAAAAAGAELSFEVKFLLDSEKVLDAEGRLTEECSSWFTLEEYRPIEVIYFDTKDRAFFKEGWINRLRLKEGKKKAERNFKKRYSVNGEDIGPLLKLAKNDGFDLTDRDCSAQIDWGYSKMTLSLDWEDSERFKDYTSLTQCSAEEAIAFMLEAMPSGEANWKTENWGTDLLQSAEMAGPLQFLRVKGTLGEMEITIEIWSVGRNGSADTLLTELSFKTDDYETAARERAQFTAFLEDKGVLLKDDSHKTEIVLDAFS